MTFLASPEREQRQRAQIAAETPGDPDGLAPGLFEGTGTAAAVGLGRVYAVANQLAGQVEYQAGALVTRPIDALFDTDATGWLDQQFREGPAALTASMTPDPYTTGAVGQVLYSLVGIGVPAAVGGFYGGPLGAMAGAGTFTMTGTSTDLLAQGLDPTTAYGAGAVEGAFAAAGVGLPAAIGGRAALSTLLYGPGINLAQDIASRQTTAAWLGERGYTELAGHYAELDGASIAADIVLGAAFGWAGARSVPRGTEAVRPVLTGDKDAALTAQDARHVEIDTAPGIPADLAALQGHAANLGAATEALLAGRPVEARPLEGAFAPKPVDPAFSDGALAQAFRESGYSELLAEVGELEAALAARGRIVTDAPLPDVPAALDRLEQRAGARLGRVTDIKIGDEYAAARWAVMEADAVAPTVAVSENQLRDRTRAASELQVNEIAAKLDPRLLLADVPVMELGAPTLTADGKVVAGNGRALAVRKAYGGERGQAYREALVERAAAYGLDPADVQGMRAPVLVRVLQQPVDVQRAAILSNEGGAARMSALEQSRVDAGRLPSMAGLELPDDGDLTAAGARDFVRGWMGQFPEGQRAALISDDGKLSPEGVGRLRNALLFRAYGPSETLRRLIDSTDPGSRNIAAALFKAAPKVAEVKDAIARGELYPLDLSEDIARAADLVEQIRDQGLTVAAWVDQLDMFSPGETPTTLALLKFMDANKRSSKALADLLGGFYDGVLAAGNPGQGSLLGGPGPDAVTLLSNAIARAAPAKAAGIVQDTLFRPFKARGEVTAEAAIRGAEQDAAGFGMPEPARALPDDDPLLQPRHLDASPERVALRQSLIDARFAGKEPATGTPIALVMGGGGASGKGTVLKLLRKMGKAPPEGAVELNPDLFKTGDKVGPGIPEYWDIVKAGDSRAAAAVHEESSLVYKQALDRALAGKYHVVLDRTLGVGEKGLAELQRLRAAGYEIRLVGVTVKPESAIARAIKRAEGPEKRFVPVRDLLAAHKGFSQAFEQYAAIADSAILFDNEVGKGEKPRLIAGRGPGGKLQVLDEKAYTEFVQKGRLNDQARDEKALWGDARADAGNGAGGRRLLGGADAGNASRGRGRAPGRGSGQDQGRQGADRVPGDGVDPEPIVAARPDLSIVDAEGARTYAADSLVAADTALARAETDALGFEAAVDCFLRTAA